MRLETASIVALFFSATTSTVTAYLIPTTAMPTPTADVAARQVQDPITCPKVGDYTCGSHILTGNWVMRCDATNHWEYLEDCAAKRPAREWACEQPKATPTTGFCVSVGPVPTQFQDPCPPPPTADPDAPPQSCPTPN